MDRSIVTVRVKDRMETYDLEVPTGIPCNQLLGMIIQALQSLSPSQWGPFRQLHADPPGRMLESHETLAEAGAWDGTQLTLL